MLRSIYVWTQPTLEKKQKRLSINTSISPIFVHKEKTKLRLGAPTQPRSRGAGWWNGFILGSTVHAGCSYAGKSSPKPMKLFCIWLVLFFALGSVIASKLFSKMQERTSVEPLREPTTSMLISPTSGSLKGRFFGVPIDRKVRLFSSCKMLTLARFCYLTRMIGKFPTKSILRSLINTLLGEQKINAFPLFLMANKHQSHNF